MRVNFPRVSGSWRLPQRIRNLLLLSALTLLLSACLCRETCSNCDVSVPAKVTLTAAQLQAPDFKSIASVADKKQAFFTFLEPMIDKVNREVLTERLRLRSIADSKTVPGGRDKAFVQTMCDKYRYDCSDKTVREQARALSERIGTVPPSMALGQAANESAWGTSRFARDGNNYFGQWCFTRGCGLVPSARRSDATHEVRRFSSVLESVRAYVLNLNSSPAYAEFRRLREQSRESGQALHGGKLVQGLTRYSERGRKYVEEIRSMIAINNLSEYDEQYWQALGDHVIPRA